jgi:hypothetical protein
MILFRGEGRCGINAFVPFLAIGAFVRKLSLKELVFWTHARPEKNGAVATWM